jgi:hypothetical protein
MVLLNIQVLDRIYTSTMYKPSFFSLIIQDDQKVSYAPDDYSTKSAQ